MSVTDLGRATSELAIRCRDNPRDREAWAELHEAVRRIVEYHAFAAVNRYPNPSYDEGDLTQSAWDGVRHAVRKFDRSLGEFTTYMTPWVRQAIQRQRCAMRSTVYVPAHQHVLVAASYREGGPMAPDTAAASAAIRSTGSSYGPYASGRHDPDNWVEAEGRMDAVEDRRRLPGPEDAEAAAWLDAALSRLEEYHRLAGEIVRRRYGLGGREPEALHDIAGTIGLSKERVRQIAAGAVERLTIMARIWGMAECA